MDETGGTRPIGYLGSVVPLDPKESGWRGAWIAHCLPGQVRLERVAVSRHRYETVELDIGSLAGPEQLSAGLLAATRARHAAIASELTNENLVIARLRLTGAHLEHAAVLAELSEGGGIGDARLPIDGVMWAFEPRVHDASRPALDVAALAARGDLASPIAQQLSDSASIDPARLEALRAHLRATVLARPSFRDLDDNESALDDTALEQLLRDGATRALHVVEAHRRRVDGVTS
ncbi:MAG: Metallophosphoesterase [Thermoleophilia bacterium]|nr:Metallophosphoesterase [Thermoleophilia bacterium]